MSKKSTDKKTDKQTEAKKPVDLKDDELEKVQAGVVLPNLLHKQSLQQPSEAISDFGTFVPLPPGAKTHGNGSSG